MNKTYFTIIFLSSLFIGVRPIFGDTIKVNSNCTIERIESIKAPEYVKAIDLGLSVCWANVNIGATSPEQAGDFFAWGEIAPKKSFSSSNYTYTDRPSVLPLSDDAAHQIWGGKWRMPTKEEMMELRDNCSWTRNYSYKGKKCAQIIHNGDTIYLPMSGYFDTSVHNENYLIWLWTSTKYNSESAWRINAYEGSADGNYTMYFYYGLPIRPVCDKPDASKKSNPLKLSITASNCATHTDYMYESGETIILQAKNDDTDHFIQWSDGNIDNPRSITISKDTTLTAIFEPDSVSTTEKILSGKFSINDSTMVRFAPGNLQYRATPGTHLCADGTTKPGVWRFAEEQYNYMGESNKNMSETYAGWIDLFGWGTSGWNSGATCYQPWSNNATSTLYQPGHDGLNSLTGTYAYADWGVYNAISNGGNTPNYWRVLSMAEMDYIIKSRPHAASLITIGVVNGEKGHILLPDNWKNTTDVVLSIGFLDTITSKISDFATINNISKEDWKKLEDIGAVFLPSSYRKIKEVYTRENMPYTLYWLSTANANGYHAAAFSGTPIGASANASDKNRAEGFSVRPVLRLYTLKAIANSDSFGSVTGSEKGIEKNENRTISATPNQGYKFISWSDGNTENPRTIIVAQDTTLMAIFDNNSTGLTEVKQLDSGKQVEKKIIDNRLYILHDGKTYNALGIEL